MKHNKQNIDICVRAAPWPCSGREGETPVTCDTGW